MAAKVEAEAGQPAPKQDGDAAEAEPEDQPIQYTAKDLDDVDKMLSRETKPHQVKLPEELLTDPAKETQDFGKLQQRLQSLKWDHPLSSSQEVYTIDQLFHSYSHFDDAGDDDAETPSAGGENAPAGDLQDTDRTIDKSSAWNAFQELCRQWDFETSDAEEGMLQDLFSKSYASFPQTDAGGVIRAKQSVDFMRWVMDDIGSEQ